MDVQSVKSKDHTRNEAVDGGHKFVESDVEVDDNLIDHRDARSIEERDNIL